MTVTVVEPAREAAKAQPVEKVNAYSAIVMALAVFLPAMLLGSLPAIGIHCLFNMDQLRLAASILGLVATVAAIPALFQVARRDDKQMMLTFVGFVGVMVGFLIPLSI